MSRTARRVAQWMLSYKDNFYKSSVGHDENRCRYLKGYDHKPCSILWEQPSMTGYDHQDVASPALRKHYKNKLLAIVVEKKLIWRTIMTNYLFVLRLLCLYVL